VLCQAPSQSPRRKSRRARQPRSSRQHRVPLWHPAVHAWPPAPCPPAPWPPVPWPPAPRLVARSQRSDLRGPRSATPGPARRQSPSAGHAKKSACHAGSRQPAGWRWARPVRRLVRRSPAGMPLEGRPLEGRAEPLEAGTSQPEGRPCHARRASDAERRSLERMRQGLAQGPSDRWRQLPSGRRGCQCRLAPTLPGTRPRGCPPATGAARARLLLKAPSNATDLSGAT